MIAEATVFAGVRKIEFSTQLQGDYCVGVLRSQLGFSQKRTDRLLKFVESLISSGARYDLEGAIAYPGRRQEYLNDQLGEIKRRFGTFTTEKYLEKDSFFCSALVVACYYMVGIIDESAQVLYPHKLISPADLHGDPTFGWFLGYMLPPDATVPAEDPLGRLTSWDEVGF